MRLHQNHLQQHCAVDSIYPSSYIVRLDISYIASSCEASKHPGKD